MTKNTKRVDKGWSRMHNILDENLPQKKKNNRALYYLFFGLAAVLLLFLTTINQGILFEEDKSSLSAAYKKTSQRSSDAFSPRDTENSKEMPSSSIQSASKAKQRVPSKTLDDNDSKTIPKLDSKIEPLSLKWQSIDLPQTYHIKPIEDIVRLSRKRDPMTLKSMAPRLPEQSSKHPKRNDWYSALSISTICQYALTGTSVHLGYRRDLDQRWFWNAEIAYSRINAAGNEITNLEFLGVYNEARYNNTDAGAADAESFTTNAVEELKLNHMTAHFGLGKSIGKRWSVGIFAGYEFFHQIKNFGQDFECTTCLETTEWVPVAGAGLAYSLHPRWQLRLQQDWQLASPVHLVDKKFPAHQLHLGLVYQWK